MAKIDENKEYAPIVTDTNGDTAHLLVDPVTERLLIELSITTSTTPSSNVRTKIDENKEHVSQAVDSNDKTKPLLIDNRSGYLFVDLII